MEGSEFLATDASQVNWYRLPEGSDLPPGWLDHSSVPEVTKLTDIVEYENSKGNWLHLKDARGAVFSIRLLQAGDYPKERIHKIINDHKRQEGDFSASLPKAFFAAAERAMPFAMEIDKKHALNVTLMKNGILLQTGSSAGTFSERVDWETPPEGLDEDIAFVIDGDLVDFIQKRSYNFYVRLSPGAAGRVMPRMLFETEYSWHLISSIMIAS